MNSEGSRLICDRLSRMFIWQIRHPVSSFKASLSLTTSSILPVLRLTPMRMILLCQTTILLPMLLLQIHNSTASSFQLLRSMLLASPMDVWHAIQTRSSMMELFFANATASVSSMRVLLRLIRSKDRDGERQIGRDTRISFPFYC